VDSDDRRLAGLLVHAHRELRASSSRGAASHPIVAGTGEFAGVTGRVDFKDVVADGTVVYRGHLKV